ncbi:hypothetical protein [Angustibacter aerolatus]
MTSARRRRGVLTRFAALAAGLVALLASGLVAAPPAQAAACSGSTGVTVVVDFGPLGGTSTRCAAGSPASGIAALKAAGFSIAYVQTQPGFVCRLNGLPTAAKDPCRRTPPTSAYWSYWHANRGGSWQYSSTGAGSRRPAAGSVEGWAFGAGARPAVAPPAAPAEPRPKPTTRTTTPAPRTSSTTHRSTTTTRPTTSSAPRTSSSSTRPSAARSTTPRASSTTSASGSSTTRGATTTTAPTTSTSAAGAAAATSAPPGDADTTDPADDPGALASEPVSSDGGTPTGALVALGLVLVVGGAGAVVARRRRSG